MRRGGEGCWGGRARREGGRLEEGGVGFRGGGEGREDAVHVWCGGGFVGGAGEGGAEGAGEEERARQEGGSREGRPAGGLEEVHCEDGEASCDTN